MLFFAATRRVQVVQFLSILFTYQFVFTMNLDSLIRNANDHLLHLVDVADYDEPFSTKVIDQ